MSEILLVEDSESDADSIERAFRAAAVANPIRRLRTGTAAAEYLAEVARSLDKPNLKMPSVLVLDLKLPGISGFHILEQIGKTPAFSKILRIVISQMENTQEIKGAYRMGAQSFITKPVTPEDVQELIKTYPGYWNLL